MGQTFRSAEVQVGSGCPTVNPTVEDAVGLKETIGSLAIPHRGLLSSSWHVPYSRVETRV